ncbi:MAG TPA: hypothetical protein VF736_06575 [Pyrinomonadaceae bacterium]|jgi:hypothetical protein
MDDTRSQPLLVGAALNAAAAALHVGCIAFGAPWYRFFGAGERMARLAAAGSWRPTLITSGIILALVVWTLYDLSGAGVIRRLPFLGPVLRVVAGVYLIRGVAGLPFLPFAAGRTATFWWWSSAVCLVVGAVHLAGIARVSNK